MIIIKCIKAFLLSLAVAACAVAGELPILAERDWTSSDGRVVKASLVKSEGKKVTLRMAKGNAIHVLDLDKLSQDDQTLVVDHQVRAEKIVAKHNAKVEKLNWHANWYYMREFSAVPELEFDELQVVYFFGKHRDLEMFGVRFTPSRVEVASDKITATVMGSEGFAVRAKADSNWVFAESGQNLNVRPKTIVKGSSDLTETPFSIGVGERLLFPNGRSIGEGKIGVSSCLLLSLDNFEPRRAR